MKRFLMAAGILAFWLVYGSVVSAAEPNHVISVLLTTGKESTLEEPYSRASLDCGDFTLETELELIDTMLPVQGGGLEIVFNNGESLIARQVSGEITYQGEFGEVKLPWSSVQKMTTVRNTYKKRETGSFSRDYYEFKARLKFRGGATRIVYLSENDLALTVKYKDMSAELWPSRAYLVFDWARRVVRASAQNCPPVDAVITRLPEEPAGARTDLGELSFAWSAVAESRPVDGRTGLFDGACSVRLSDGTALKISIISHMCSDWSSHGGQCLRLNGRAAEEIFWQAVAKIRMTPNASTGTVSFRDGKEGTLSADLLRADWALGSIEIPFSGASFSEVVCTGSAANTRSDETHTHSIRLTDGQEWIGILEGMDGFPQTTAPGVLHLLGLPVPLGTWLAESDVLDLATSGSQLFVKALGQSYPVSGADLEQTLELKIPYGRFRVATKEVESIRPIRNVASGAHEFSVTVVLRAGGEHVLSCEKIQFVRYPDRIWSGTMYNQDLGAWFWRQYDAITVGSESSTTDVQLSRVKQLKISGTYPSWNVEVVGSKTGAVMKGHIMPAEVAAQSPGVSSWDGDNEGFWFWSSEGRAFLFIPIATIAEINVSPGPQ
ncbi:MAG TPA: hypothetical protein VMX58_02110 [Patescibacteria group bacterium]|nr:hypothetical protein [Patescibacteria group bacterium]